MPNVLDLFKNGASTLSLKYYGAEDMMSAWDIKALLDNAAQIIDYFNSTTTVVNSFDAYIDFLFLNKYTHFAEMTERVILDKNKVLMSKTLETLSNAMKNYKKGDLTGYINTHIKSIMDHQGGYFDLDNATLEICVEYQNEITDEVFLYLAETYPFLLICKYSDFQKRIEPAKNIIIKLFESATSHDDFGVYLRDVVCILQSIYARNKKLFEDLGHAIDNIVDYGTLIIQQANEENIIALIIPFNDICAFLQTIKSAKANLFLIQKPTLDELKKQYISKKGVTISYEYPPDAIKIIQEMLGDNQPWEKKLVGMTQSFSIDERKFISVFNKPPRAKRHFMDFFTRESTNDYFTWSHQNHLDVQLSVGGLTVYLMLSNEKWFSESLSCLFGFIDYICTASNCTYNNLEQDYQLLVQMLNNVYYCTNQDEGVLIHSLCYGTAMFLCAFLEKLLKNIYISISLKCDEVYISINKVTFGWLFSEKNDLFKTILGEYQLKHLKYFFGTNKDRSPVGHDYRNKLAHWNDISESSLTKQLVSELFFLFVVVITSFYCYFSSFMKSNDEQANDPPQTVSDL